MIAPDRKTAEPPVPLRRHESGRLSVEQLSTPEAFLELQPGWCDLWDGSSDAAPFQSPEWLIPWWRHLGHGSLRLLAVRDGSRLVGLAPLNLRRNAFARLSLLGTGISDYLGLLAHDGYSEPVLAALSDYLNAAAEWDMLDFQQLPRGCALEQLGATLDGKDLLADQDTCPFVKLPDQPERLLDSLPAAMRRNVVYCRRRLLRAGGLIRTATDSTAPAMVERLFHLHTARWRSRLLPGVLSGQRIREFHREAAAGMMDRGWLRLHALELEGRTIGVLHCMVTKGRAYYYASGFLPEYRTLSPGTLLIAHAMEDAVRLGAGEFDFLRGEEPYKYRWGAVNRVNRRLLVWRPGVRGAAGAAWCRAEGIAARSVILAARRFALLIVIVI